jgi:tripartite-type tricarboxylate transporter receptor subunit TctC
MLNTIGKLLMAALMGLGACAAMAQNDYPNKPIHIVVAWPPASGIDTVMRHIAEALRVELGQPIVIENKAGAAGALGSVAVANAAPDGYTLLFNSAAMNMLAAMQTRTAYTMPDSFTPVVNVFSAPMVLVATPSLNIQKLPDLVALAKAKNGDLFYATSGHGAPSHFVAELFRARTGIAATAVPMKGSPQAMLEQIAGRVAFHFAVASTALAPAKEGRVTAVAVTSKSRLAVAPNIPTMDEFGLKNFNASYWNGIFGPKGLPPAIVDRLAQAFNKVMAQPDIQAKLVPTAIEVDSTSTQAQFAKMIKDDYATWAEAVRFANIQAQ